MKFAKHAFISYGHIDNKGTSDEAKGWVTRFYQDLTTFLSTDLGEDAVIWLDDQLTGNDIFAETIVKQFPETATLVSVLSERYLKSDWCDKEVNAFCAAAQSQGGVLIGDKTRLLKVLLRPLDANERNLLPPPLRNALGYEFYTQIEGGHFLPLDPQFGAEQGQAYLRKVCILSQDLAKLVKELEGLIKADAASAPASEDAAKPLLFLAECSYDCSESRQKLLDELLANGYTVFPQPGSHLPDLDVDYASEVTRLLQQCDLAVHLVGTSPGKILDGKSGKSAVRLQAEVAAKMSAGRPLSRIIWMPQRDPSDPPPPESSFIDSLTRDSELQRGADLIVGDVEELKSAVRNWLKKKAEAAQAPVEVGQTQGGVYLVCLENDLDALSPLTDILAQHGCALDLPVFSGDATEVREANEALAMKCNAVILFCGAGDGAWMFHQQNELRRIAGLRRDNPWKAQLTLLAAPTTADKKKELLLKSAPGLVNIMDGFAPDKIQTVFNAICGASTSA